MPRSPFLLPKDLPLSRSSPRNSPRPLSRPLSSSEYSPLNSPTLPASYGWKPAAEEANLYAETHIEQHFSSPEILRDIVIGLSDGLTVPFALAAGISSLSMCFLVVSFFADAKVIIELLF